MQKRVVVTVDPDGTTSIDAQNFKGKGCQDATEQVALALGGVTRDKSDDRKKPDYFATNPGTNTLKG
jgi:hypothetical protein